MTSAPEQSSKNWQFWVDRGGTFTDILGLSPQGQLHALKLLSVDPEHYDDATLEGIRRVLNWPKGHALSTAPISAIRTGTTLGTNALLERKGDRTLWVTGKGFGDALRIGDQTRSDLFALGIQKPSMLYEAVLEVDARVSKEGEVLSEPDWPAVVQEPASEAEREQL